VTVSGPEFAVVGDCLLDVAVRSRLQPEQGADVPATIELAPGGQGANVAVRLAQRGRAVRLLAPLGDDAIGAVLRDAMVRAGVELCASPVERSGAVAVLIGGDGERTMYSDRRPLDAGAATVAALRGVPWIHVSGYALLGREGRALAEALAHQAAGARVSVNGGSAAGEDAADLDRQLAILCPSLVIFSRSEAAALLANPSLAAMSAADRLVRHLDAIAIVTDGAGGAVGAARGGAASHVPAVRAEAIDATGAGDAFVAAVLDTLAATPWPPSSQAMDAALAAGTAFAARVVGVVGAQTPVPA
jgi:ribokinase